MKRSWRKTHDLRMRDKTEEEAWRDFIVSLVMVAIGFAGLFMLCLT